MMGGLLSRLPALSEFFPPTPKAWTHVTAVFKSIPVLSLAIWTPLRNYQSMGKTSTESKLNLPGRYAWAAAELVGPFNLLYILYALPGHLKPVPQSSTSFFGTGLPLEHEILGLLYMCHYINRAIVTPLFLAPSMSPIHVRVAAAMAIFQYMNSTSIAGWIVYSGAPVASSNNTTASTLSLPSIAGISLFALGLAGNIAAEQNLFSLRRGAAKRKAKSEGRAEITYDKVYVIPPSEGLFKYMLSPHYTLEWIEWVGYWILGGAWGLGYGYSKSAALWFLLNEIATMTPRAYTTRQWYEKKFGIRAVAGRAAVIPGLI